MATKNQLMEDTRNDNVQVVRYTRKSVADAYLCAIPMGLFGLHRFYLGQTLLGFAYLFSGGFFGIGWLHDLLFMPRIVEKVNRRRANPSSSRKEYSLLEAYVLCLNPAGIFFGLHQFYLGRTGFGVTYCFTIGILGIGWIVDIFRLPWLVEAANLRAIELEESPASAEIKQPRRLDDAYVLWVFGITGVHHFYLGNIGFGFAYLFTFGMGGVGWIIDFFRMPVLVKRANMDPQSKEKHLDSAYVLTFPFGMLGLQHFYLGRIVWGFLYLFTFGLLGIGFLADLIRMPWLVAETNQKIRNAEILTSVQVDNINSTVTTTSTEQRAHSLTTPYQAPLPPINIPTHADMPSTKAQMAKEASNFSSNVYPPVPPQPSHSPPPSYMSITDEHKV